MKKNVLMVGMGIAGIVFLYFAYTSLQKPNEVVEVQGEPAITVVRTETGYEPSDVTIKKGDIVRFTNESSEYHWPASDLHPTHGVYPAFDPLKPIAQGESWQFQFDQVGTWNFHDHIRANKTGTIMVTE